MSKFQLVIFIKFYVIMIYQSMVEIGFHEDGWTIH